MLKKIVSVFVTGIVLAAISFAMTASAEEVKFDGYNVPIDVDINGNYLDNGGKGFLDTDGITYIPVRFASNALGAQVSWNQAKCQATVKKGSTTLVFDPASNICYVNGKKNKAEQKHIGGVLYINANFLFPALGGKVGWDSYRYEVKVTVPGYYVPSEYIETYYTPDDLYWLSKITTCEAGNVSFVGKVMVANVILNRRASKSFPNTIKEVIYDKKFGTQFPPAHNGSIDKANPTTHTILACKAALNGLMLAPDCLYFNYASNKTGWVAKNRQLYKVVGNQAFYK